MGRFGVIARLKGLGRRGGVAPPGSTGLKALSLGMNLPKVKYDDAIDYTRDLAFRCFWYIAGNQSNKFDAGFFRPFNSTSIPMTSDGGPITGYNGATVGTFRGDADGNIFVDNSLGSAFSRIGSYSLVMPYFVESGRGRDFIIEFPVDVTVTAWAAFVAHSPISARKYLVTIPASPASGVGLTIDISGLANGTIISPKIYSVADTTGFPSYTRNDPNSGKLFHDAAIARWKSMCSHMRLLDPLAINADNPNGSTTTAFSFRTAAQVTEYFGSYMGPKAAAKLLNDMGMAGWLQCSHRDSREAMVAKAAIFALCNWVAAEYSNETWNSTTFPQFHETNTMGLRAGLGVQALTSPVGAVPHDRPIYYFDKSNRTATPLSLTAGSDIALAVSGSSWSVYRALVDVTASVTPMPIYGSGGTPTVCGTGGCLAGKDYIGGTTDTVVHRCIADAPPSTPWSNATYFQTSPLWALTYNTGRCLSAGRRWRAQEMMAWWRIADAACVAVGRPKPKHVINVQHFSTLTELQEYLDWNDGLNYCWELYDESSSAPYLGSVAGTNIATYTGSIFSGDVTNWTPAHRAGLYDASLTAAQAVSNTVDQCLSPGARGVHVSKSIANLQTRLAAEQTYLDGKFGVGVRTARMNTYEMGINMVFQSGWLDHASAWAGGTYTAGQAATQIDPGTSQLTTYRCLVGHSNVNPAGADSSTSGTWQLISNGTDPYTGAAQQRLPMFYAAVIRDARFGLMMREYHAAWRAAFGDHGWITHFDAQNDMPTTPGSLASWGHQEQSDAVSGPLGRGWEAMIADNAIFP